MNMQITLLVKIVTKSDKAFKGDIKIHYTKIFLIQQYMLYTFVFVNNLITIFLLYVMSVSLDLTDFSTMCDMIHM